MTITLRISLLYSTSTTKVTKQLPHILYHTFFFLSRMNMRTLQHDNGYQADSKREKNRIRSG